MSTHEMVVHGNEILEKRGDHIVTKDYQSVVDGYRGMALNPASSDAQLANDMINLLQNAHERSLAASNDRAELIQQLKSDYTRFHGEVQDQKEIRKRLCDIGESEYCDQLAWKEQYDA